MRLSLVFPRWTEVFGSFSNVARGTSIFPPTNLTYLAAIAEKEGHDVQLIDGEAEFLNISQMVKNVKDFKPDLIGITSTTPTFHVAEEQAKAFKEVMNIPIISGGPHITHFKEKVFSNSFDFFVIGQCEGTFGKILDYIENNKDLTEIPGLLLRKNGDVVFTGENPQFYGLDDAPFPARNLLKNELYQFGTLKGRKIFTTIMTSRGCPYKCVFCYTDIYGSKVRTRSVENVISELKHIIYDLGIDHIYFLDETLTLNRKYVMKLCEAIENENLKFTWEGSTRADMVDEELISKMAKNGLIRLAYGLETADLKVREIIKKKVPLDSYISANELTNKYGIETINSVMLGLPGDTYEGINSTIKFVRNARAIKHATFGIAIPYPGSEMYEMAKKGEHGLKLLTEDFSKYQRYNSAVMSVNGMSPEELLRLQKKGLMKIYLVPWRIIPVIKRFGLGTLIKPFLLSIKEFFNFKKRNIA
ncbi:B12-binding domain-containing radical SAM protein [candidate division KSB1 bacterium]